MLATQVLYIASDLSMHKTFAGMRAHESTVDTRLPPGQLIHADGEGRRLYRLSCPDDAAACQTLATLGFLFVASKNWKDFDCADYHWFPLFYKGELAGYDPYCSIRDIATS